jgi:hypothetical protein
MALIKGTYGSMHLHHRCKRVLAGYNKTGSGVTYE